MKKFKLPPSNIPNEAYERLFIAWVQYFAEHRLAIKQHGSGSMAGGGTSYKFGDPKDNNFSLERTAVNEWSLRPIKGILEPDIEAIIDDAKAKAATGDFGGDVAYQATLKSPAFAMTNAGMMNFIRLLGDQRSISGPRRLGRRVLLEFAPEVSDKPEQELFTPATDIKVALIIPGPVASDLTQRIAMAALEIVAAICAFALGRPVEMPMAISPAKAEDAEAAKATQQDDSIPNLARESISLDIFDEFVALGGLDGFLRVRGALLSYHAALQQASPDVAMMLLVSATEALIVPRPDWRKDRATKRFIEAVSELCPAVVDELVSHPNSEQAFSYARKGGPKARRRQVLDQIYALRSAPTHSGLGLTGLGFAALSMLSSSGSLRVALLSNLARGALLSYLQAPRSFLIGHPMFDQVADSQ
jgi:hypothetical protein